MSRNLSQKILQSVTYMPPKKQALKKEAVSRPDNSGIPKNDIQFKWQISVTSSAPSIGFIVLFQWFGITSDKIQQNDTPAIQTWNKEEGQLVFRKQFGPVRVDDDFCKRLCSDSFYVYLVDPEDGRVRQQIFMDLSGLLMSKGQSNHNISYSNNKLKIMQIQSINITVEANKELISPLYRHYLNPFQIQVVNVKETPDESNKNYLPTYVKYQFYDGSIVNTHSIIGKNKIVWGHKHVFLLGLLGVQQLKQKIRSTYLRFQLHDRDQVKNTQVKNNLELTDIKKMIDIQNEKEKPKQQDPKKKKQQKKEVKKQAKKQKKKQLKSDLIFPPKVQTITSNFGVAAFYLIDFLKPNNLHVKLRSSIVPKKLYEDYESKNIDLNTTARTEMQKVISSNTYFDNDTSLTVSFTLSHPIGSFDKSLIPVEVAPIKEEKKTTKQAQKKDEVQKQQSKKQQLTQTPKQQLKQKKDVFERIIYLFPYKSQDLVKTIQNIFYQVNLKSVNLSHERIKQLTNMILKPEQKTSKTLDFISGIEIIDPQFRMFVFEGLKQGAMKILGAAVKKEFPNNKTFKIFKNSNLTFIERLYSDFNLQIKRIRLRPSLDGLLVDPSIYIRSKVSEDICNTLNNINSIKKIADNLSMVTNMNMWLTSKGLLQVQNKYSSPLTEEDITGDQEPQKLVKTKLIVNQDDTLVQEAKQKQKPKTFIQIGELTPAERQKELRQQKKREQQLQKSKLKGDANIHIKRGYAGNKTFQTDKYKDILDGSPTRKGLMLPEKVVETSKIGVTKFIESQPVSIFIQEPFDEQKDKLSRIDKPHLSTDPKPFNNYQNTEILTKTSVYKPLKKSNFD